MEENLIQSVTDILISSAGYLWSPVESRFQTGLIAVLIYSHLDQQFADQAVLQSPQTVKQMLLVDLLVAIIVCNLLAILYGLYGILCKFTNIHKEASLLLVVIVFSPST
jgi:hypothetical protein